MIHGYGSIPINTIFRGMNIHLPAILMFTTGYKVLTHCHIMILYHWNMFSIINHWMDIIFITMFDQHVV